MFGELVASDILDGLESTRVHVVDAEMIAWPTVT
jgi:hypothetical protein